MAFLKVKNRAVSTLASGISDSDLSLTVATGEGALFPSTYPFHITIEDEILECTTRSTDVLTVTREAEGTTAAAHDADKAVQLRITAGIIEEIQNVLDGGITGAHLSQTFGASAAQLRNVIISPVAGKVLAYTPAATSITSGSIFAGAIDAAGTGGLTATNVPYDGDTKEGMFAGLTAYDGTNCWGQIILHNTTRGNSRKIVSVNVTTDVITTTSSTDDWADDDVITCQSQTNAQAGYFDVDLSDSVASTSQVAWLFLAWSDGEGNADAARYIMLHPYTTYNAGYRQWGCAYVANEQNTFTFPMAITSQKITIMFGAGCNGVALTLNVVGINEGADT